MSQKPSVGHIVHYRSYGTPGGEYGSACRAAVVTEVGHLFDDGSPDDRGRGQVLGLAVLNPEGMFFNRGVKFSDELRGGTWHWPERV